MTDFLKLGSWDVAASVDHADGYRVDATYRTQPGGCPKCGVVDEWYKHGTVVQAVNDTTHSGKPVVIDWQRQRYRCRACEATFLQPSEDIDQRHLMTTRLTQHIEKAALRRTFVGVAEDVGVSEGTVRNVFHAYAARMEAQHVFSAPDILGIDELHLRGRARCILTNITDKHILDFLDFLEDRTKDMVYRSLRRLVHRERVSVVAMDMYRPYHTLQKLVFPKAVAVVDKFHIQRMASQPLDAMRKLVGQRVSRRRGTFIKRNRHVLLARPHNLTDEQRFLLAKWLGEIPELRAAYDLKEQFYDIWLHQTVADARSALHAWRATVPLHLTHLCKPLITDMDRAGRGYSFEVLRIKALFAHQTVTYRRPARLGLLRPSRDAVGYTPAFELPEVIGVPLSTFADALKQRDG
jgi:transposase